jgi:hypothetical protein
MMRAHNVALYANLFPYYPRHRIQFRLGIFASRHIYDIRTPGHIIKTSREEVLFPKDRKSMVVSPVSSGLAAASTVPHHSNGNTWRSG